MHASIQSERKVTPEELVGIADEMYAFSSRGGIKIEEVHKKFPEFSKSYPVVTRYICEHRSYDSAVFRRWINKFVANPFKNEDEYLESQADYVRMLFKAKNPRAAPRESREIFNGTLAQLKYERDKFKADYEKVKKMVDERDARLRAKSRVELAEYLKNMPPTGSLAVESDVGGVTPQEVTDFSIEPLAISAESLLDD